jgi:uncharacterized protein YjgD (DUF1641 family)
MGKYRSMLGAPKLKSYINAQIEKEYKERLEHLIDDRYKEQISKLIEEQYEEQISQLIDKQISVKINENNYIEELISRKIAKRCNVIENNWNSFKTTAQSQITRVLHKLVINYKNRYKRTSKITQFY